MKHANNHISPSLVVSDGRGNVTELENYRAVGVSGEQILEIQPDEWIPLPDGSELMELPERLPVGVDRKTGETVTLEESDGENVIAVAAFIAPAYTIGYHAAWERKPNAPRLSLYAYCAVGWQDGKFYIPATRVDPDIRQDPQLVNRSQIERNAKIFLKKYPNNRLVAHLINNCALTYGCPAALNYLMNRWEMPLPTSRTCNANCLGCISLQKDSGVSAAQFRIDFTPTVEEIIEITIPHFETAPLPVASFGQGCEGEPLMNADLLIDSVKEIRRKTLKGTINLNTNASKPDVVRQLRMVGLDSMRVSMNSARHDFYEKYYRPSNYSYSDILESIRVMKELGGFVSINLFVFPGFTDQPGEIAAVENLIKTYNIDLIQWRNLNIDPEWYWETMNSPEEEGIGIRNMIDRFRVTFPNLQHGYFNPYLNR